MHFYIIWTIQWGRIKKTIFTTISYLWQLSFRNSISVENDPGGLEPGRFVELNKQFTHHVRQILNDLLPGSLDSHCGTVSAGMSIHTAYHLEDRGGREWHSWYNKVLSGLYAIKVCHWVLYVVLHKVVHQLCDGETKKIMVVDYISIYLVSKALLSKTL